MYGSGKPTWTRGGDVEDGVPNRRSKVNSGNSNGSYQRGPESAAGGGSSHFSYQPPQLTGAYAEQQTQVVEDAMRTLAVPHTLADDPGARDLSHVRGEVRFEDVSFAYGRQRSGVHP